MYKRQDIGVEPLKKAFEEVLTLKASELSQMGVNGRELIESKYSMQSVSKQMIELYEWVLHKNGKKPNFIID